MAKKANKPLRVGTLFSGIGAFEQALKRMNVPHELVFACDNGERYLDETEEYLKSVTEKMTAADAELFINAKYEATKKPNHIKTTYFANYGDKMSESKWFNDIRFMDGKQFENQLDILVGGSPCQSFSVMGKRAGLEDTRGTLFYDYARMIRETHPNVFIFENVPGMLVHDKGRTWKVINEVFDSLGYEVHSQILDAQDYGIPQKRKRLFVVGFKDKNRGFEFPKPEPLTTTLFDFLEPNVSAEHYLGEKGFKFVTDLSHPNRTHVNHTIAKTQKANQQFNWNGDFIFEPLSEKHTPEILKRAYVGEFGGKRGVARKLTNRECFRLMGFPDSFKIEVPAVPAYRQAGNSIVVNVLEKILANILKVM